MKNSKGFAQIILILVVLALVAGAYYFGTLKTKLGLSQVVPTQTLIPFPISSSVPTPSSVINWKTYSNLDWAFSIKYPRTYEVLQKDDNGVPYIEIRRLNDERDGTDAFSHSKIVFKNSTDLTVDEAIKNDQAKSASYDELTQVGQINIAGTQASSYYASGYGHVQEIYLFNKSSNKVILISINSPNEEIQKQEQVEVYQILSTFKFTK